MTTSEAPARPLNGTLTLEPAAALPPWPTDLVLRWGGAGTLNAMAVLSPCERYRYLLMRTWDAGLPRVVWIMLNPSTADETVNDATIRKCMRFAQAWRMGGIVVANLFGYRATKPRELAAVVDPVGRDNNTVLRHLATWPLGDGGPLWMAGWGTNRAVGERGAETAALLSAAGVELHCLATTRNGNPQHPLYVREDTCPSPYPPPG